MANGDDLKKKKNSTSNSNTAKSSEESSASNAEEIKSKIFAKKQKEAEEEQARKEEKEADKRARDEVEQATEDFEEDQANRGQRIIIDEDTGERDYEAEAERDKQNLKDKYNRRSKDSNRDSNGDEQKAKQEENKINDEYDKNQSSDSATEKKNRDSQGQNNEPPSSQSRQNFNRNRSNPSNNGAQQAAQQSAEASAKAGAEASAKAGAEASAKAGAEAGAKAGAQAGAKASSAAGSAAGSGGAIAGIGTAALVILIIVVVLGIIFFFITMPGMVVGKIGAKFDEWLIGVKNFFNGSKAAERSVDMKQMVNAARYLEDMGYDLQGYGFLDYNAEEDDEVGSVITGIGKVDDTVYGDDVVNPENLDLKDFKKTDIKKRIEKETDKDKVADIKQIYLSKSLKDIDLSDEEEVKKNILMVKNNAGEVEFAKSKYLYMYLIAANSTYLVKNDNLDFAGRVFKLIGKEEDAIGNNGIGLIYFAYADGDKVSDYVANYPTDVKFANPENFFNKNRYDVDKKNKLLIIYNSDDGLFKETSYKYNLSGWISQYGMPLQLSLALHLASMAPDFAYEVAENAAQNTKVELGLVEMKDVSIHMKLKLDLNGDGSYEEYTIERDWAAHLLSTGDGDDDIEEGYTSQTEANRNAEKDEEEGEGKEENDTKTCMEELEELEEEIKQAANGDRIVAGTLAWQLGEDTDDPENLSSDLYTGGGNSKVAKFVNGISSNYIYAMRNILEKYGIGNSDSGHFKATQGTEFFKVKQIIKDYFKLTPIDEVVCCTDSNSLTLSLDSATGRTLKQAIGDSNIIRDGQTHSYEYASGYSASLNVGSNPTGSTGKETGIVCQGNTYYYNSTLDSFVTVNIEGDYDNIKNLETFLDYFIDNLFVPFRFYYRLLDENGEPVTSLTYGKGINDYCYTTSAKKYFKDTKPEGWFWQHSIPLDLYNAIKRGEFDYQKMLEEDENGASQPTNYEATTNVDSNGAQEVLDILDKGRKITTKNFTKYVPIIRRVSDHWFEDLYYGNSLTIDDSNNKEILQDTPCYEYDESEGARINKYEYTAESDDTQGVASAANSGLLYMVEESPGKIVQKYKPQKILTGDWLYRLVHGSKYYIYDGRARSDKKREIDFSDMAVDVIAMLEQIQGEDAQQIIRMFKIYMAEKENIKFEATTATKYKKEICSKIMAEKDYNCADNLLTEDDSSLVLRADIPPAQYGFPTTNSGKPVYILAPVNGEVVYRSDDSVCIRIDDSEKHEMDEGETPISVKDWTILISGFIVNNEETLKEGQTVTEGMQIGKAARRDIKMVLRDENGAIIENKYDSYVDIEYDQHKGNITKAVNGRRSADDIYYVIQTSGVFTGDEKARIGGANDEFITALVDMQDAYGIDPLWALAVAHWESHCGTAYGGEYRIFNISEWDGIKGQAGTSGGFATYNSDRDAIMDFGNYAANRFNELLTTVDDFEEHAGLKLFENAKKKDYPTYLKLKTIYSSKGV